MQDPSVLMQSFLQQNKSCNPAYLHCHRFSKSYFLLITSVLFYLDLKKKKTNEISARLGGRFKIFIFSKYSFINSHIFLSRAFFRAYFK